MVSNVIYIHLKELQKVKASYIKNITLFVSPLISVLVVSNNQHVLTVSLW